MKPNVSSSSTFPWRGRRGSLATHHGGGMMKIFVQIHGGWCFGREEWRWKGEEVERKWKRERKVKVGMLSQMKLVLIK